MLAKTLLAAVGTAAVWSLSASNVQGSDSLKPDTQGYVRDWLMLAPIPVPAERPGGDVILEDQIKNEAALQPRAGDTVKLKDKELTWKKITAATNYFDFNEILKSSNDHAVGYMVTYIQCDKAMKGITMAVGSNDEGRLYLNGQDIYAFTDPRPLELDADKGKVNLKKGVNVVVFKILNEQNSWQGAMRFLNASGAPVTDLKIKLSP